MQVSRGARRDVQAARGHLHVFVAMELVEQLAKWHLDGRFEVLFEVWRGEVAEILVHDVDIFAGQWIIEDSILHRLLLTSRALQPSLARSLRSVDPQMFCGGGGAPLPTLQETPWPSSETDKRTNGRGEGQAGGGGVEGVQGTGFASTKLAVLPLL